MCDFQAETSFVNTKHTFLKRFPSLLMYFAVDLLHKLICFPPFLRLLIDWRTEIHIRQNVRAYTSACNIIHVRLCWQIPMQILITWRKSRTAGLSASKSTTTTTKIRSAQHMMIRREHNGSNYCSRLLARTAAADCFIPFDLDYFYIMAAMSLCIVISTYSFDIAIRVCHIIFDRN